MSSLTNQQPSSPFSEYSELCKASSLSPAVTPQSWEWQHASDIDMNTPTGLVIGGGSLTQTGLTDEGKLCFFEHPGAELKVSGRVGGISGSISLGNASLGSAGESPDSPLSSPAPSPASPGLHSSGQGCGTTNWVSLPPVPGSPSRHMELSPHTTSLLSHSQMGTLLTEASPTDGGSLCGDWKNSSFAVSSPKVAMPQVAPNYCVIGVASDNQSERDTSVVAEGGAIPGFQHLSEGSSADSSQEEEEELEPCFMGRAQHQRKAMRRAMSECSHLSVPTSLQLPDKYPGEDGAGLDHSSSYMSGQRRSTHYMRRSLTAAEDQPPTPPPTLSAAGTAHIDLRQDPPEAHLSLSSFLPLKNSNGTFPVSPLETMEERFHAEKEPGGIVLPVPLSTKEFSGINTNSAVAVGVILDTAKDAALSVSEAGTKLNTVTAMDFVANTKSTMTSDIDCNFAAAGVINVGLNPSSNPFITVDDKGDKNEKMTDNIMKVNLIDPLDQVEEKSGKAENTSSVTCISVDKATENNKDKPKETQKEDKIKENAMGKETEENKEKVEEKEKDVEEVKQEQSDTKKEKGEEFKKLEVKEQEIKFVKEVQKEMEREKDKELNEVEVKEKEIKWLEEQQKTEKERGGELKKVEVKDNEMEKVIEEQKGTEKDEGEDLKNVEVKDKEMEGVNKEQKETKKEKGGGFKKAEVMEKEMEGVLEEQKETEKYKGGELKKADVKDKEMEGVNKEQEETEKEKGGGFKKVKVMEKEMEGVEEDQKEIDKIELMQKMKKADEIIKVMESPAKSEKTGFGDLETKKKVEVAFETVKVEKAENIEKVQRSETSDVDEKVENKSTEQLGKEQDIGKVEETPEQQSAPVESSTGLDKLQNAMGTETKDKALSVETKKEKPDISNAKKPDKVDKMEKPSGTPAEKSVQKSQKEFKQDKIHGEKKTAEKKDGRKDKTTKADAAEKAKKPSKPAVNAQSTTQSKGLPSGDKKAKSAVGSTKTNTTAKMRPSATAASVGSAAATKKRPTLSSTTSTSDTLSKKPSTTKAPATTTVGPKKPATTSTSRPLNTATTCDVKPKVTSEKRPPVSKASTITSHQTGTTITKNGTASAAAKPATSLRTTASARTTTTASAKTALASKTDNKRGEQKKPSIPKTAPAEATKPKTTISRSTASTTTPTASRTRTTTSKPATISSSIGTLPEKKSSMSRTTRANSSTTTTTTTSTSRATARPTTAPAPDIRNARSKVGSTNNMKYQPGGGKITSASHNSVASKEMNQGKVQILNRKVDVSKVTSKCGSKDNLKHKPGGGDVKIESHKVNFKEKARSKVGSMDNVGHSPGGGNVKAEGAQETTEGTGTPLSGTSAPAPSPEPGQTWAPAAQENGLKGVALCDEGLQEPQGLDSCIPETSI
ncbi:microtubule-associated protein 4 isoform X2 [Thalassophryne amazonica]|uniref:microtubule-associated protein 4 isoform X2 n=1 Tax=Thalassophryne amazonica TaxID=390379 RepID=UPI0014710B2F|nr:microtubule-associated protein 4 isoform X2 [Thalassophryne amazonica]